jgi:hypothetical protein
MKKLLHVTLAALVAVATITTIARQVRPSAAQTSSFSSVGGVTVIRGINDPTAGAGVACPRPCFYARFSTADELYYKTGAASTAWSKASFNGGAASFTTVTATGDITSTGGNLVATAGDVTAGDDVLATDDVVATGDVSGVLVTASTALQYPSNGSGPALRASDDTDTGLGSASNTLVMYSGGFSWWLTNVGSVQTSNTATVITSGAIVASPRTVDIDAVGDTLAVTGSSLVNVTLSAGNITPTSTPFMAAGTNGQVIRLVNGDSADTLTLTDEGGMAGSNLQLGAATRALGPGDSLTLLYLTAPSADWFEIAFTNN